MKRTRPPSSSTTPASRAASRAPPAPGIAAVTRSIDGRPSAAAAASGSRVDGGSAARRSRTRSPAEVEIGSPSRPGCIPPRCIVRAISRARNGFPPDSPWIQARAGRRSERPSSRRVISSTASRSSGPTCRRSSGPSKAAAAGGRAMSGRSARTDGTKPTRAPPTLRMAYSRTRAEGPSSHCRSSTAMTTGDSSARARSAPSVPSDTARGGGSTPPAGTRWRATSSATRWASGSRASTSSSDGSRRSASPPNASCASASTARVDIVR